MSKLFNESELEGIARALGDTDEGLTNSEIDHLLNVCKMKDDGPGTKWRRIYNAFVVSQNTKRNRTNILEFIRQALKPVKYLKEPDRFEKMRANTNRALVMCGLLVEQDGTLQAANTAKTINDANRRANELRADLNSRGVHPDVLQFCKEELLQDNYFHAVLEAVKSVGDKLRRLTGLTDDGGALVDRALGGQTPMLTINEGKTDSQRSEQKGFANLVKGTFGMFRNPTAHEAKIFWDMKKHDAEDLLSLVSLIHRRLDDAKMPPRV